MDMNDCDRLPLFLREEFERMCYQMPDGMRAEIGMFYSAAYIAIAESWYIRLRQMLECGTARTIDPATAVPSLRGAKQNLQKFQNYVNDTWEDAVRVHLGIHPGDYRCYPFSWPHWGNKETKLQLQLNPLMELTHFVRNQIESDVHERIG